ncbi:hypothetical protein CNR22_14640 [Sphingobacteriaceae bacterium]|nr:hypothetical protein CNR22_14640 [Sphingobacteriaceae bacterium]
MKGYFVLVFTTVTLYCSAQKIIIPDSVIPKGKTHYKYFGIQANLLLQQFISFNSNASINSNPYIFCYSKSNIKSGNGFAFGTGFNVSDNSSNDGVSAIQVQNLNVSFRVGFDKKYLQQERFIPFWGVEFGAGVIYNKTSSSLNQSFNTNRIVAETTKVFAGPSCRGGLMVAFTKHILLGTEFYLNAHVAVTEETTSANGGLFSSSQNFIPINMGFQAPTALFLIFRY